MRQITRVLFLIAAASCLLLRPAWAADAPKGHLVSVDWLEQNLKNPDVLVLDASFGQAFAAQHIPGAVNVDFFTYGGRAVTLAETERRIQSWGVSSGKKIVMYDRGDPMFAARLFYELYYHGYPLKDLFILDGGFAKWQEFGRPVAKAPVAAREPGTFRVTQVRDEVRARLPEFLTASGETPKTALIEALEPNWHYGAMQFFNRPGHVPHSTMLPSGDFYNADKTFKSPDEIKKMLEYLGVRREQTIYTYCGSGVAASVPFFALKFVLGYPNVKVFNESEIGWLQDSRELPLWTYNAPYLMRESQWLKTWGGAMMRMTQYGQVSVIDVRSPEAYAQGHVPFAVNIPAEVFKSHLATPEKLAALLGPAGVNPAHEAVVVSGSGLDPRTALAYLMLERLGHKKVSVFMDSSDKSAQGGLALTKVPTTVGMPKSMQDLAVPPATYPAQVRKDLIVGDAKSTTGLYPKVFIASGKALPAKAPEGKVVHVPYSELLNPDGTPKAAKDIWAILVKAGVPRYAELVLVADELGEAAANYYLLKLMGFPDVKVMAL